MWMSGGPWRGGQTELSPPLHVIETLNTGLSKARFFAEFILSKAKAQNDKRTTCHAERSEASLILATIGKSKEKRSYETKLFLLFPARRCLGWSGHWSS